jgi:hypothetical protein
MLAVKTYNCSFIYQRYQPLYVANINFLALCFELFLNLKDKIEKIIVLYSFYKPFYRTCLLYTRATKWCLIKHNNTHLSIIIIIPKKGQDIEHGFIYNYEYFNQ